MVVSRQCCQYLCKIKKNDIEQNNTCKEIARSKNPLKPLKLFSGGSEPFAKAGGAQHFILMFGNALTAEKSPAFRTAGHGLTQHVI
jgi:hypothetical protein